MELTATQQRFEQLVDELERLKSAAAQIDQNASTTGEIASRVSEIVGALELLVPDLRGALEEGVGEIKNEGSRIRTVADELQAFQKTVESRHETQLEDLSSSVHGSLTKAEAALRAFQKTTQSRHETQLEDLRSSVDESLTKAEAALRAFQKTTQSRHETQLEDLRSSVDESLAKAEAVYDQKLSDLSEKMSGVLEQTREDFEEGMQQLRDKVEAELELHTGAIRQEMSKIAGKSHQRINQLQREQQGFGSLLTRVGEGVNSNAQEMQQNAEERQQQLDGLSRTVEKLQWNMFVSIGVATLSLAILMVLVLLA